MGQAKQKEHKSHSDTPNPSCPTSHLQEQPVISGQGWGRAKTVNPSLATASQQLVFSVQTASVSSCPVRPMVINSSFAVSLSERGYTNLPAHMLYFSICSLSPICSLIFCLFHFAAKLSWSHCLEPLPMEFATHLSAVPKIPALLAITTRGT